jgi:hypothetical protein
LLAVGTSGNGNSEPSAGVAATLGDCAEAVPKHTVPAISRAIAANFLIDISLVSALHSGEREVRCGTHHSNLYLVPFCHCKLPGTTGKVATGFTSATAM